MSITAGAFLASPQIAAGTMSSAIKLCLLAKEPFLQKTGASRLGTIAYFDKNKTKIVEEGGLFALARLLNSPDEEVQLVAADVLLVLAEYPESGRHMAESEVIEPLVRIVSQAQGPDSGVPSAAARVLAALATLEENREALRQAGVAAALRKAAAVSSSAPLLAAAELLAPKPAPKDSR